MRPRAGPPRLPPGCLGLQTCVGVPLLPPALLWAEVRFYPHDKMLKECSFCELNLKFWQNFILLAKCSCHLRSVHSLAFLLACVCVCVCRESRFWRPNENGVEGWGLGQMEPSPPTTTHRSPGASVTGLGLPMAILRSRSCHGYPALWFICLQRE